MSWIFKIHILDLLFIPGLNLVNLQLYHELCQVFGQASAPSLRTIQRWVATIRGGTFTLEKETSLGRPSSTYTQKDHVTGTFYL